MCVHVSVVWIYTHAIIFVPVCDSVANTEDTKSIRVFVEQMFQHAHICVRVHVAYW